MKFSNEAKIGILVVGVLVILAYLTIKTGKYSFSAKSYELKVEFKDIDNVTANSPVTLNGFEIGRVKSIQIVYGDKTRVLLTLWLKDEAKLHQGAKAFVKNMGFLGEKFIALTTGNDNEPYLQPGATIIGEEPVNFDKMLYQGQEVMTNINEISKNLNERLKINSQAIDDILAHMRVTMGKMASITTNVDERLQVNKGHIDNTLKHLSSASTNLDEMSYDLKDNPWKLMYKTKSPDKRKEVLAPAK